MKKIFILIAILFITSFAYSATLTTNYSLYKPEQGDTGWADNVNSNFDTIDAQMKANEDASGIATTDIDTYSELNTIVADVTLTHNGLIDTYAELNTIVADQTLTHNGLIDTFAELDAIVADVGLGDFLADGSVSMTAALRLFSDAAPTTNTAGYIAFDNNAWAASRGTLQFYDGTATAYVVSCLASDTPSDGQVCKWNSGGTGTWENDDNTASVTIADTLVAYALSADTLGGEAEFYYDDTTNTLYVDSVQTAASATPSIDFVDSDTADGDTSATILTDCTNNGSGTEDCPIFFKQQIAGTMTEVARMEPASGLTLAGNLTTDNGVIFIKEQADADADVAGYGQLWVNTATPNELWFTDDAGTDTQLGVGGTTTVTECKWISNPVAETLESVFSNRTGSAWTLTSISGESDQTVNFDWQVDDGTPADVNGTDISPAAGKANDDTLSGDTELADDEQLDLVITSVSGSPTWLSACFTSTR